MKIGIGIPTYNRLDSLKRVVASIETYADLPYDLFVSVDGATDGTVEWLQEKEIDHISTKTMLGLVAPRTKS